MPFDLQIFNKQTYLTITETVAQAVDKFNAASAGTILLSTDPARGDFDQSASFKEISGLVRRRNVNGSGPVAAASLQQLLNASVKVAAGTPPIEWTPAQYSWTLQNPALAALKIGEQLAKAQIADQLNTGIRAAAAAASGQASVVTGDGTAPIDFKLLNTAASKFGDRSSALRAWAMHSASVHALYANALTNTEKLFTYEGVNVIRDAWGRLFVITDSPALVDTSGADPVYKTLGLVEGAVAVRSNDDFNSVLVPTVGNENIGATYQAEWSYNVGVLGYTWDTVAGGPSPNDTALGTSANWKKTATSVKNTAGVLLKTK